MANSFELEIATPERLLVRELVREAEIPALDGALGVLPDHAALLTQLGYGPLTYKQEDGDHTLCVMGGFLEIRDNHVRVLADAAEKADEIDAKRAEDALHRANERLTSQANANLDVSRALNAMKRAEARLAVSRRGH